MDGWRLEEDRRKMQDKGWMRDERKRRVKVLHLSQNQIDHQVVGEVMEIPSQALLRKKMD